jgi:ferrous iron transport protein A
MENQRMSSGPDLSAPACRPLSGLALHETAQVHHVDPAAPGTAGNRAQQLADIGFVPGEGVSVVARAWPGGDPLVVRVGHSRFALRKAEADCIFVSP